MLKIRGNFIQIMLLVSNIFLFITVVGLFMYVRNVENQVNLVFSTFTSQTNSIDDVVEKYQGNRAINFELQIVGSEKRLSLTDLSDSPSLLVFTWTECIYCKAMYPELIAFSEKYSNINVIMISRGTPEANQELIASYEFSFPVLQGNDDIYADYNVPGTPFFYYLNEQGYIDTLFFANTVEDIERYIFNNSN